MPEIKLKHVVSCSSEDNTHKAENLLKADTYRKWKAARVGEKHTSVILQFEKSEQIHSIDIGNEGSAFVEVLVGNSSSVKDQDYEVILVTSSFMSPSESRASTNLNRVRMFGPDKLVKANAEKKWDRVKIICTQPYNKTIAYGVSFIKLHSPPDGSEPPTTTPPKLTKLGQFKVKEVEPSSSSLMPGSLFFSRTNKTPTSTKASQNDKPSVSYAVAALQSTGCAAESTSPISVDKPAPPSATPSPKVSTPGKRKFEFSKERQATSPPPAKKPTYQNSPESEGPSQPKASPAQSSAKKSKAIPSPVTKPPAQEKKMLQKKEKKADPFERQEFSHLLEGTIFVLSGFQNPFRAELRDKALAMGAKYRPDWTPDCTHLICAFSNTPKYSQVKVQGGTIVRKEWILDCHKRKQKISFKRYLMDGAESSSEASEEEESEEDNSHRKSSNLNNKNNTPQKRTLGDLERPGTSRGIPEDEYGGSTDEDRLSSKNYENSGMDTEDELKRVECENKRKKKERYQTAEGEQEDPYAGSTDENTDVEEQQDLPIPQLPDFLTGKNFFLYGEFPKKERRLLNRYITAFNGVIEDYMGEKVQFVITAQDWDDRFEAALMENSNLSFVKPRWIYVCNERQKLVPHQPFVVVPQV
ncbi:DNA repair protein XRCC1 isoform X2 [Amia ocellicauda]|uniref:DNA repair protein XRCC1 isoform X2 n=1 Tax=Amia ocellicauda TaxID=2972642 RepID=UPI003463FD78